MITPPLSFWVATANVVLASARDRCSSTSSRHAQHRPRSPRGGDHAAHRGDHAGRLGRPAGRSDRLYDIARRASLRVIEDAAQAFGARWRGKRIGSFGDLVSFSFHANKNITTVEGGAWCSTDAERSRASSSCACRAWCALPTATWRSRLAGRQVQPHRHRGAHRPRAAEAPGRFNAGAGMLAAALLRALGRRSAAASCRRADDDGHNWHMFQALLPLPAGHRRAASSSTR